MLRKLLPFVLTPVLASCNLPKEAPFYSSVPTAQHISMRTTWDVYGKDIEYVEYDDLDTIPLSDEVIPVPWDMHRLVESTRVHDREKLDILLGPQAQDEETKNGLKEVVDASLKNVAHLLDYLDVDDKSSEFVHTHGKFLTLEEYLALGKGDCERYTHTFIEDLNYRKKTIPALTNVYAFTSRGEGNIGHLWARIVVFGEKRIFITDIDPTFYETQNNPRTRRGYHLPLTDEERTARFYARVDPKRGKTMYDAIIKDREETLRKTEAERKKYPSTSFAPSEAE